VKVAITGAGGLIGRNLNSYLSKCGFDVVAFSSTDKFGKDFKIDLLEPDDILNKLSDFDVLIHSAWAGSERTFRNNSKIQNINIEISKNLVKSLEGSRINQLICFGSQAEFSETDSPWSDNSPKHGDSEYAFAKISSYEILKNSTLKSAWMRLFSVYGSNDDRDWVLTKAFSSIMKNKKIVFGSCRQLWSLTHVEDVANATRMIIEKEFIGELNVSDLTVEPLKNHLLLLQQLMGKDDLLFFEENDIVERALIRKPGEIEKLGWKAQVSTTAGFKRMINEQL
jgi:nucleoside-diphosphate-sugar epimerase